MVKVRKAMLILVGVMFLCALVPALTAVVAKAQVMELRYASPYAPAHPYSAADLKWMEKIEKETNGKVKFKPYWNNTLISSRETMTELTKGVADVAFITPIYEKSGVDLTRAMTDFFSDSKPELNAKIYWELYNKFPEIRKEYDNVKILAVTAGTPMMLMTTKKAVRTLDDMKGIRIRVTGDAMMQTMKALGLEPVNMPVTEMLESLQKGIIQAVIFAHGDYRSLKLAEVVKFETENFTQDRGVYPSRAMNKGAWAKLPADIQKVFDANINWWGETILTEAKKPDEEGKAIAVKAGVQFVNMDAAGLKKYNDSFDAENVKTAQALDAKGYPASKIYQEARRLVKQYNK